jgi:hypothetical protein
MDFLKGLGKQLKESIAPTYPSVSTAPADPNITPIPVRVLMIIHNPVVKNEGGQGLITVGKWRDPDELANGYMQDVHAASYGYVNYKIVERVEVDGFPVKKDGFAYTTETFLKAWRAKGGFHQPDAVDYMRLVHDFHMVEKINANQIDEVWLMGMPYAGYNESVMGGRGAFWCNGPVLEETSNAQRRFVIMGFNYERGVGEMLEDLGHRVESTMSRVYQKTPDSTNLWKQFIRYDKTHPNLAECGNVHFAPNSERDYDWGNKRPVKSFADDWLHFPELKREARVMDCSEWGNGDIRGHHVWWLKHLPHVSGSTNGISNNWWEYVMQPDKA